MGVPLVYPATLPCPQSAPFSRSERRALSALSGKRQSRTLWRDRHGTIPVQFLMTFEQVAIWLDWIETEQVNGGAWFAADWRVPFGRTGVFRFMSAPTYPEFIPIVGWRVSAEVEVRGRGMPPESPSVAWEPVLRNGMFRYSLVDSFSYADPSFDETLMTLAQGTFGDVNPHPFNGPAWPVNTITPQPNTGDVIWVRYTSTLADFISTWRVHIVNDNTVRAWFNGVEVFPSAVGSFDSTVDVTPVLGDNVFVIRVVEINATAPTNHSQAGFEITR